MGQQPGLTDGWQIRTYAVWLSADAPIDDVPGSCWLVEAGALEIRVAPKARTCCRESGESAKLLVASSGALASGALPLH